MKQFMYGVVLLAVGYTAAISAATDNDPFARDLLILTDWFAGDFDNEEQRWFEADPRSATAEDNRVIRLHVSHRRIQLPAFGEHVFYVEEFKENNPDDVIRQRLVIFSSAKSVGAIRMRQGFFKDADAVRGAHIDPDKLKFLAPGDVMFLDECDVFWRRVADQFHGSMKPKHCVFGDGAERRYSVHDLTLSETKYWRVDSTFLVADDSLFRGYALDRPIEMRRAITFFCDVFFYETDGDPQRISDLQIHSQGGLLTVTRKRDGAMFDVLMRSKEYPYYETRPDFIYFSIRRGGEARSIAFSVNDPDSRQLGMRTEEIGAFCHRKGYEFRETIDEL